MKNQQTFSFVATEKLWNPSRYADIPAIPWGEHDTLVDLFLVAGGLALILSRCTETLIRQELAATHALHEILRTQLRRKGPVDTSAELISEVMHEVAEHADPGTRNALKRCLDARVTFESTQAARVRTESAQEAVPAFFLDASASEGGRSTRAGQRPATASDHPPPSGGRAPSMADPVQPLAQRLRATVEEARQRRGEARTQRHE